MPSVFEISDENFQKNNRSLASIRRLSDVARVKISGNVWMIFGSVWVIFGSLTKSANVAIFEGLR